VRAGTVSSDLYCVSNSVCIIERVDTKVAFHQNVYVNQLVTQVNSRSVYIVSHLTPCPAGLDSQHA